MNKQDQRKLSQFRLTQDETSVWSRNHEDLIKLGAGKNAFRLLRAMHRVGANSIGDLSGVSMKKIRETRSVGENAVSVLMRILDSIGIPYVNDLSESEMGSIQKEILTLREENKALKLQIEELKGRHQST